MSSSCHASIRRGTNTFPPNLYVRLDSPTLTEETVRLCIFIPGPLIVFPVNVEVEAEVKSLSNLGKEVIRASPVFVVVVVADVVTNDGLGGGGGRDVVLVINGLAVNGVCGSSCEVRSIGCRAVEDSVECE